MNIEVTEQTFRKIMDNTDFMETEELESANKHYYYSDEYEQRGIIISNFTSSKTIKQYYFTDINI
jgi:hypothetical protein